MANGADLSILPVVIGIARPMWIIDTGNDVPFTMLLIDLGLISPSLPWCQIHGQTVLHRWALAIRSQDSILKFKKLLEKGADVNVLDKFGLTPLNVAAIGGHSCFCPLGNPNEHVLNYLVDNNREDISLSDKIEALELAGASILLFKEDQDSIDRAFQHWYEAHDLRDSAKEQIIPKASLNADKTVPWRSVEWATRDELDQLRLRPLASIKMQALLVMRRFLVRISSSLLVSYLWTEFVSKQFSLATLYRENRFNELLDISWLMLEGTNDCQEPGHDEYWKMVVEVNYWLVISLVTLKKLNSPILNLEMLKFALKLVFDPNNQSPYLKTVTINHRLGSSKVVPPMGNLFNLMYTVVCPSPEMITSEVKSLLMQFVKREARDR